MLKLKLQYFGHLMQRADSLEKSLMLGKTEGKMRRGRQGMRWLDGITDSMDVSLSELREMVKEGNLAWRAAVPGVSKGQTRLSDWTTATGADEVPRDYQRLEVAVIAGLKGQKEKLLWGSGGICSRGRVATWQELCSLVEKPSHCQSTEQGGHNSTPSSHLLLGTHLNWIWPEAKGQEILDESCKKTNLWDTWQGKGGWRMDLLGQDGSVLSLEEQNNTIL